VGGDPDGGEHCTGHDGTAVADLFVPGVEDEVGDLAEWPVPGKKVPATKFGPASGRLPIFPEPSTWVLACLGAAAVGLKARRRSRAA
ncbi:MAG: hypothetical protein RLZZ326_1265, partial [Planctomycetota bacterium]